MPILWWAAFRARTTRYSNILGVSSWRFRAVLDLHPADVTEHVRMDVQTDVGYVCRRAR